MWLLATGAARTVVEGPTPVNISAPFTRRPIGTSLLAAALLRDGIWAYTLLAVAPVPRVDMPTIQVSVSYPGASPETMA
jgi:hydrophobic/amphiphilic exporter-1 (mainly G- bacteria), HAE1 family